MQNEQAASTPRRCLSSTVWAFTQQEHCPFASPNRLFGQPPDPSPMEVGLRTKTASLRVLHMPAACHQTQRYACCNLTTAPPRPIYVAEPQPTQPEPFLSYPVSEIDKPFMLRKHGQRTKQRCTTWACIPLHNRQTKCSVTGQGSKRMLFLQQFLRHQL
jgi:hypothetical protein